MGFPSDSVVKHPLAMQQTWVQSLGWKDPLEDKMAPTSVFCPQDFPGIILARKILWTEDPGLGSQRLGHNSSWHGLCLSQLFNSDLQSESSHQQYVNNSWGGGWFPNKTSFTKTSIGQDLSHGSQFMKPCPTLLLKTNKIVRLPLSPSKISRKNIKGSGSLSAGSQRTLELSLDSVLEILHID